MKHPGIGVSIGVNHIMFGKNKPILTRPRGKPAKRGEKPIADIRVGRAYTPMSTKDRVGAVSPDLKRLNLPGRKTPKGKTLGEGDYNASTDESLDKTLPGAVRKVMKGVAKAKHQVRFSPGDKPVD